MKTLIGILVVLILMIIGVVTYHKNKPATTYELNNVQECAAKITENHVRLSFLKPLKNNPSQGEVMAFYEQCEEALQKQELDLAIKKSS